MNQQLKTVLLTVLTLSVFVIALVELSGVSKTALFNKYGIGGENSSHDHEHSELTDRLDRDKKMRSMPKTKMVFDEKMHDFGTITEGEKVKHSFHFRNVGEHPLLITNAVASCGCTVPSYPKEPIPPGGDGNIEVEFNSSNRVGHQQKNVMIYSNAEEEAMSVGFEVEVKEK
jgi:hypothetical protein